MTIDLKVAYNKAKIYRIWNSSHAEARIYFSRLVNPETINITVIDMQFQLNKS